MGGREGWGRGTDYFSGDSRVLSHGVANKGVSIAQKGGGQDAGLASIGRKKTLLTRNKTVPFRKIKKDRLQSV